MGDNGAILAGYTVEFLAHSWGAELHILVQPDTDLESRFRAWDCDECEWINVNGWMFEEFEPLDYTTVN